MALQAVKYGFPFPAWPPAISGAPGLGNVLLDSALEKAAYVFALPVAKAIRKIHFLTGTVTTGATLDCRVETVDTAANGDPTGTLVVANANIGVAVADSDDNVWKSGTLTADTPVPAIGDVWALVVANGTLGNLNLRSHGDSSVGFPYGDLFTVSWAKSLSQYLIIPEYADGTFAPTLGGFDIGGPVTNTVFASDSTTNRRGNIFQLAFPNRATGCWVWVDADGPFTVNLYDSDGTTVLATTATTNLFQRQANAAFLHFYPFLAAVNLSAGVNYRLAIVPTTTTGLSANDFTVPVAGMLDMFPGGSACHRSVYTSSAWVETTTARTYLGVFLDAFDDGASAGGGASQLINSGALVG